jgi:hypothetical protein
MLGISEKISTVEPTRISEKFKIDARVISDAIIGLSDGLTVPFALTAGLSTLGDTNVVVYGGMAELIAGAISMGLGGYLGAKSERYARSFILVGQYYTANIYLGNHTKPPSLQPAKK